MRAAAPNTFAGGGSPALTPFLTIGMGLDNSGCGDTGTRKLGEDARCGNMCANVRIGGIDFGSGRGAGFGTDESLCTASLSKMPSRRPMLSLVDFSPSDV